MDEIENTDNKYRYNRGNNRDNKQGDVCFEKNRTAIAAHRQQELTSSSGVLRKQNRQQELTSSSGVLRRTEQQKKFAANR